MNAERAISLLIQVVIVLVLLYVLVMIVRAVTS